MLLWQSNADEPTGINSLSPSDTFDLRPTKRHPHIQAVHYSDVIIGVMASQIASLTIGYSTVYSGAENIKAPRHWPFVRNSPMTGEFPAQMASNTENVSIWWRHHAVVNIMERNDVS